MDGVRWIHAGVRGRPRRTLLALLTVALAATFMFLTHGAQPAHATSPQALILLDSVSPGSAPDGSGNSLEQYEAQLDGYTVTGVTGAQWDAMTAAQFAQYQVLIIGDPTCANYAFAAAQTNESTWEPVVMSSGGNKVIIGTDPTYHHYSHPGADTLEGQGIAFAGAVPGATGAYVDLSCTYTSSSPGTPVPLLDGLSTKGPGSFTVGGAPCAGSISIVSASGPTSGLHDVDLANWSCSVHEFFNTFPSDYTPLALATDPSVPVTYTGTDVDTGGTVTGSPYIMVSGGGVTVKSNLTLTPPTQNLTAGGSASVVANLSTTASGINPGASIQFDISAGPNAGKTFTGTTNGSGNTTFTYPDTGGTGTDQILATYTSPGGVTSQGSATVTWTPSTTGGGCTMTSVGAFNSSGRSIHIENTETSDTTKTEKVILRSLTGAPQFFELTGTTDATCHDNTDFPVPPGSSFNTLTLDGSGSYGSSYYTMVPGFTIHIEASDRGDTASADVTTVDKVDFQIYNAKGGLVWQGSGLMTSGGQEETG